MRTIEDLSIAMKSISATDPVVVSNTVSRIIVFGKYRLLTRVGAPAGLIRQYPLSELPSKAAKQAGLSKRGQQSQSIDPSLLTSAAVRQSPISA